MGKSRSCCSAMLPKPWTRLSRMCCAAAAGVEQERRLPQPLHALAAAVRAGREGAIEVAAEHRARRETPRRLKTIFLPSRTRLRRLLAELADARPAGLGGVELLQDDLPLGALPVGGLDPVLELLDLLGQLGVLALPDRHRFLVVLVGGRVVVVLLALGPRLLQLALRSCDSRDSLSTERALRRRSWPSRLPVSSQSMNSTASCACSCLSMWSVAKTGSSGTLMHTNGVGMAPSPSAREIVGHG